MANLTPLAKNTRSSSILVAVFALILLPISVFLAAVAPMGIGGGGSTLDHIVVYILLFSPILLLTAAVIGVLSWRKQSSKLLGLAVLFAVPFPIVLLTMV